MGFHILVLPLIAIACLEPGTDGPPGVDGPGTDADSTVDSSDGVPDAESGIDVVPGIDVGIPEGVCQVALDCSTQPQPHVSVDCRLRVADASGRSWYDGTAETWLRGDSSLSASVPKNQYGLELHDDGGNDAEVDLLNMGSESDWVLNGNYYDRSLIRNKWGYDTFQAMGGSECYAPESAFCELILNGQYWGVYTLQERIKRDAQRIDLEQTGEYGDSFVMEEAENDCFYQSALTLQCFKLVYPKAEEILDSTADGLVTWLQGWEAAALLDDPFHPETGYFAWVDMDSAVDAVLLEELMKNGDFYCESLHIWKDRGARLHYTPWDLDMTWGNLYNYEDYGRTDTWINPRSPDFTLLHDSADFRARLVERWRELRSDLLSDESALARIDGYQTTLGDAIDRNYEKWDITTINFNQSDWMYEASSYEEEDEWIRAWLLARLAWMDEYVADW